MDDRLICENCEEEADELFETTDGTKLCSSCLEAEGYEQCAYCERWFDSCPTVTPAGEIVCDECLHGSITFEEFTGECRFLMETVNYEILNLDDSLEKELREKLISLVRQVLADGNKDSRETLNNIFQIEEFDIDNYSDNMLEEIVDDCMSDKNIVQALSAFGYDVREETMIEGPHGHGTAGVIFVR